MEYNSCENMLVILISFFNHCLGKICCCTNFRPKNEEEIPLLPVVKMLTIEELLSEIVGNFSQPYSSEKFHKTNFYLLYQCQLAFICHLPDLRAVEIIEKYPEFIKFVFAEMFIESYNGYYLTFCSLFIKMKYFNLDEQVEKILEILRSEKEDKESFEMLQCDYIHKLDEMELWISLLKKNYDKFWEVYAHLSYDDEYSLKEYKAIVIGKMNADLLGHQNLICKDYFPNVEFPQFLPFEIFSVIKDECFSQLIFPINSYSNLIYAMYLDKLTLKSLFEKSEFSPTEKDLIFRFMQETRQDVHSSLKEYLKSPNRCIRCLIRKFLEKYPTHQSKLVHLSL